MEIIRAEQDLCPHMDVTNMEEYRKVGSLHSDYHTTDIDFWAGCDYEFLRGLNVGDVIQLSSEETGNLSPFVKSIQLDEGDWINSLLVVKRKIYSADSLDVYVEIYIDPSRLHRI